MKKKLTCLAMVLALTLSLSVTAFATEIDQDTADPKTGTTAVTLNFDPSYTVTIPATVELSAQGNDPETYEGGLEISAEAGVRLPEGKQLIVTIDSDFTMEDDETGSTLDYTVSVEGINITNNGTVATFISSTAAQSSTLIFAADDPEYAGDYSDTVTFTISITDAD